MLKRVVLLCVLVAALVTGAFFASRAYRTFVLFNAAQATGALETSSLRGWMTIDYVIATYAVPGDAFRARLGVPVTAEGSLSLRDAARFKSLDVFDFVREVQMVIADLSRRGVQQPAVTAGETGWLDRLEAAFLEAVLVYGYPALGLTLLLGSFGLPVPTGLATSIAGAVARTGGLDWFVASALVIGASVLGDLLAYALGRAVEPSIVLRHGRWFGYTPHNRDRIERAFTRWGALTVLMTRTLASHLSSVASLLAGFHRYDLLPFLAYSALGRVLWTIAYFGLGYLVGANLEAATSFLENLGLTLSATLVAVAASYLIYRSFRARPSLPAPGQPPNGGRQKARIAWHLQRWK